MVDSEIERWCQEHNWAEPRQLEVGIWVAFPPGGVIETPIPIQSDPLKNQPLEYIADLILLIIVTFAVLAIAIIMSPCFIEPMINRYRHNHCSKNR